MRLRLLTPVSLLVVLAAATAAPSGAQAAEPSARASCGVRLLSAPVIVTGDATGARILPSLDDIGEIIDEVIAEVVSVSEPVTDEVVCQPVKLAAAIPTPRASFAPRCKNAGVSGARLSRMLASKAVRCLISKERRSRGLNELSKRIQLKRSAKRHSRRMVERDCFSHQCPGELDIVGRVVATEYLPCGCRWTVGENIAWGDRGKSTPASIVKAWMASPPHRELILLRGLKDVEVGVSPGKPGNAKARAATYTANFGVRD